MAYKSFEELEVYKAAREFRKKIYQSARNLPRDEEFNLKPQMMRAAVSLTNNIAEGHGRYHYQESIQFCRHSRGSLSELIDDLNVCLDEKYFSEDSIQRLKEEAYDVIKILNGYVAYLKKRKEST